MSALTAHRRPAPAVRHNGRRVLRLAVVAVGLHRAINLTTVLADGTGLTSTSMTIAFTAAAGWGGLLMVTAWRHGAFRRLPAMADVGLAATIGLVALTWGGHHMTFSYGVLQGAALVAGCSLPIRSLAVAVSTLVSVKLLAAVIPAEPARITPPEFAAYATTLVVLALVAAVAHRALRAAAIIVDQRQHDVPRSGADNLEYRRLLHDTALATLTAIANGVLDVHTEQVRTRAAHDAAYLRTILQAGTVTTDTLPGALSAVTADATALGLRLHPALGPLPSNVDPPAVTAMAMATREALNNVHRHAGTREAWLTAAAEEDTVVVRIVDRGAGFTPEPAGGGSGIRDSIVARMRQAGGAAWITSMPGEGTCIELRWPR